jgi:Kef-type K+ transport system membrane component KefB
VNSLLLVGIIVFTGFIFGELATKIKLPKITGYLVAGILLNPDLVTIVPQNFVVHTDLVTNIALSFITFSVGGTLFYPRIKRLGRGILYMTVFEAEFAFLVVILGFLAITPVFIAHAGATWAGTFIPMSLLIGSLASPTDPTATLAVIHEYKAKGDVSSTIMGIAAFDDALGIINYSLALAIARVFILHTGFNVYSSFLNPLLVIIGAVFCGIAFGFIFNIITRFIKNESEGVFIVVILALLSLCFGVAKLVGVDELLATMAMGATVVNYNEQREMIFKILERYTEELIFVLFFTISGMHLNFSILLHALLLVLFFVVFRTIGKFSGCVLGAALSRSPGNIKKYTIGGIIPQGGIVIGLALMIKQTPAFDAISDIIISVIIGATVIHELIGPISSKMALTKAGEIGKNS